MDIEWLKSDAAATLLAVIIGSMLTVFTTSIAEKSNRKNRKTEQIREHQINSLKKLIHIMQNNDYILNNMIILWEQSTNDFNNNSSSALKQNIITNLNNNILKQKNALLENQEKLLQKLWELKFLRYGKKQISIIDKYYHSIVQLLSIIGRKERKDTEEFYNDISRHIEVISKVFKCFVEEAKDGLSEKS